jgi:hypothetical protein
LTKVPFRPALDALRGKTNGRIEMAIFVTKAVLPANTSGVAWQSPKTGKRRFPGCASRRAVSCSIYISALASTSFC